MRRGGSNRYVGEILITSSHRPSRRVRSFINDLARTFPKAVRINRGKKSLEELRDLMKLAGYRALIIINTWKANPGRIDVYVREGDELNEIGSLYISSTKLSREQRAPNCFFRSPMIDPGSCDSDECWHVIDILNSILGAQPGKAGALEEKIHIEANDNIYIWFSKRGKICGPRIGIKALRKKL